MRTIPVRERQGSLRLDACEPDHFGPLLRILGNESCKIRRRADNDRAAQVGKPGLDLRLSKARVDLLVESPDDLRGRIPRRANPEPGACFVARYEIRDGLDSWQRLRAHGGGHRERA